VKSNRFQVEALGGMKSGWTRGFEPIFHQLSPSATTLFAKTVSEAHPIITVIHAALFSLIPITVISVTKTASWKSRIFRIVAWKHYTTIMLKKRT